MKMDFFWHRPHSGLVLLSGMAVILFTQMVSDRFRTFTLPQKCYSMSRKHKFNITKYLDTSIP